MSTSHSVNPVGGGARPAAASGRVFGGLVIMPFTGNDTKVLIVIGCIDKAVCIVNTAALGFQVF
jgi:hypothetical protein